MVVELVVLVVEEEMEVMRSLLLMRWPRQLPRKSQQRPLRRPALPPRPKLVPALRQLCSPPARRLLLPLERRRSPTLRGQQPTPQLLWHSRPRLRRLPPLLPLSPLPRRSSGRVGLRWRRQRPPPAPRQQPRPRLAPARSISRTEGRRGRSPQRRSLPALRPFQRRPWPRPRLPQLPRRMLQPPSSASRRRPRRQPLSLPLQLPRRLIRQQRW